MVIQKGICWIRAASSPSPSPDCCYDCPIVNELSFDTLPIIASSQTFWDIIRVSASFVSGGVNYLLTLVYTTVPWFAVIPNEQAMIVTGVISNLVNTSTGERWPVLSYTEIAPPLGQSIGFTVEICGEVQILT